MSRTDPRPNYGRKWRIRNDGYKDVYEPNHPLARKDGYLAEHRKVAYDAGQLVNFEDEVHHLNGNKTDNRVENLVVLGRAEHARLHSKESLRGITGENSTKEECVNGHPLTPDNIYSSQLPYRVCITCARENSRSRYQKSKRGQP